MKKKLTRIIALALALLLMLPLVVACGKDEPTDENDNDKSSQKNEKKHEYSIDDLRENYPSIYEALLSYFRIDDGELTEEMLAKVERIDIEPALYLYEKEGDTLYDVYINENKDYGGALEHIMTAARYKEMMQQLTDNGASQFTLNRFRAFYMLKDYQNETLEVLKEEMLRDYPECAEGPIYVLTSEINVEVELVGALAEYTDFLNNKYMKEGTVIDGNMCYAFPNLKELRLRGIEADDLPKKITVIKEKHVYPMPTISRNQKNIINKIDIQNSVCSYTLTYNAEKYDYCINDVSYVYDQYKLSQIYSFFIDISGKTPREDVTAEEITNMLNDKSTVTATVTLNDGKSYKMYVQVVPNYYNVLYDSDNRIIKQYANESFILQDISELKAS